MKFPELIATAVPVGAIAAWVASHLDAIKSSLQLYTLLVGAIGGTFAMLFWVRRWLNKKDS